MDNGFIDSELQNGTPSVAFNLLNENGGGRASVFLQGGDTFYNYLGGSPILEKGDEGLRLDMTLTGTGETMTLVLTRRDGETSTANIALESENTAGTALWGIELHNGTAGFNSSNDLFFNSLQITMPSAVPEAGATLLGCLALVISCFVTRRCR